MRVSLIRFYLFYMCRPRATAANMLRSRMSRTPPEYILDAFLCWNSMLTSSAFYQQTPLPMSPYDGGRADDYILSFIYVYIHY